MWIRPNSQVMYLRNRTKEMEKLKNFIPEFNSRISKEKETDMDFEQLYRNDVFTSEKDLKMLYSYKKIDVVIFTGYAGCGHYAPARALALEYANKGKNVVLIDPLFIYSEFTAKLNCRVWRLVSSHLNLLWRLTRKVISSKLGSDLAFSYIKGMQPKEVYDFIKTKKPQIILSTYPYTSCVLSTFSKYTKYLGIVVPDLSAIGFLNEVYHNTKNIHFLVSSYKVYEEAVKMYPYIKQNAGVLVMGNTPTTISKAIVRTSNNFDDHILLFNPGSGLGIGKGFKALRCILKHWEGKIILLCGNNKRWLKKAKFYSFKFYNLIPLGYVDHEILHRFYEIADVIIGKGGGSTIVEMASIRGCKIVYSPIPGQEAANTKRYVDLGCITYAKNKRDLIKYLEDMPYTQSIYDLNDDIISKFSTKYIVNTTLECIKK